MELEAIAAALDRAIPMAERNLEAQLEWVEAAIGESRRAFDDLGRVIGDVSDDVQRDSLRRELRRLEEQIDELLERAAGLTGRDVFDAVRDVSTDLKVFARHPHTPRQPQLPV